ncbi:hypothetical protein IGI04_013284 [Brassica rapa subsp. trilocularis]|uniref:Uncharacterized protein n=1 Tax=Brassica rapa subsp. trilocularis TaxID=1813537 RepID=A0ABQ7N8F4_BRACM|nr:hypothetical protein IGI04_013284 [Brassica rapa subsp. trilocularis]
MRATLDFHGFSGGFTTVRQFLSRCWSSSEMLQGVEKEGLHMRGGLVLWLGANGGVWRVSPSCGGVEPLGFKGSDVL